MDGIGQNYISLSEAAKYSGRYSQEYLSLRARQGKLKAVKIGRNWVTTKKWVDEYIKRVEEYKSQISDRKKLAIPGKTQKKQEIKKEITKPTLTPTFTSTPSFHPGCRARVIAIVCALVFVFSSIGLVFGYPYYSPVLKSAGDFIKESTTELATNIENFLSDIEETIALVEDNISGGVSDFTIDIPNPVEEYGKALKQGTVRFVSQATFKSKGFIAEISQGLNDTLIKPVKNFFVDLSDRFSQYVSYGIQALKKFGKRFPKTIQGIGESINQLTKNFVRIILYNLSRPFRLSYQFITHLWQRPEEGTSQKKLLPKLKKEGLVVIPSAGRGKQELDEIKESIKASFSDEVRVIPEDENSGIIVPIFREREGQEYIYLMVPVR